MAGAAGGLDATDGNAGGEHAAVADVGRPAVPPQHQGWLSPKASILLIGGVAIGGLVLMFVIVIALLLLSAEG